MNDEEYFGLMQRFVDTPPEEMGELIFRQWRYIPRDMKKYWFDYTGHVTKDKWAELWAHSPLNRSTDQ